MNPGCVLFKETNVPSWKLKPWSTKQGNRGVKRALRAA